MVDEQERPVSMPEIEGELLTLAEATELLGISKQTLYRIMERGDLKGVKVGRQWRFRKADLSAYLERGPEAVAYSTVRVDEADDLLKKLAEKLASVGADVPAVADDTAEAKIIALTNRLFLLATSSRASDIHLVPFRGGATIRLRVDGVLHDVSQIPGNVYPALLQRLKSLGDISLEERGLPQDGRLHVALQGNDYDMRINTMPTVLGESAVIRILDQSTPLLGLDRLGFHADDLERLRRWVHMPSGLILATGPTGSGKTTTLYSCLMEINTPEINVLTVEDPVEYLLSGTRQVGVNRKAGLTFPVALRGFLRHDPDAIMIGEIRDRETAEIVVQAALTGHLLLSTLHTTTAAGGVMRLSEIGIEPFLTAGSLIGVLSQRLVRALCPHCKAPAEISSQTFARVRALAKQGGYHLPDDAEFYRGSGCKHCGHRGYLGRTGLYELLEFTPAIREAFLRGASHDDLQQIAIKEGMHSLVADGIKKAVQGVTTIDEVLRVTM